MPPPTIYLHAMGKEIFNFNPLIILTYIINKLIYFFTDNRNDQSSSKIFQSPEVNQIMNI